MAKANSRTDGKSIMLSLAKVLTLPLQPVIAVHEPVEQALGGG